MLSRLRNAARELLHPHPRQPDPKVLLKTLPPLAPEEPLPGPACPSAQILKLTECPVCGGKDATRVSRYNKFVVLDRIPDPASPVYNYTLCQECGVVYAALRPADLRYAWLLEHFEETIGRIGFGERRSGKLAISSYTLTDEDREHLRRLASKGVFVSDHLGVSRKDFLPTLMNDRLSSSIHVEILGSLLLLDRPRVLEIRSRVGSISAGLKRLYRADCHALSLFENQQLLIQEVYDIPAKWPIDFDRFSIPFDGDFDLIVSNHMLTHAVRPREFFATVRSRLRPGGHLYLYNEPIEADFIERGKSMFNTLNPFHLQAFNGPSAVRALEANGFRMIFCTVKDGHFVGLAQMLETAPADWPRMTRTEFARRRQQYRVALDLALLRVPDAVRVRVASEWDGALERALANGTAEMTKTGQVRVRPPDGGLPPRRTTPRAAERA